MNNFQNIKLEKSMYNISNKSFSELLESLDPSNSYQDVSLNSLDAYERQLKRFDIKISGPTSDCIQKFFSSTDSSTLFPEYVVRSIKSGFYNESILNNLIATKTYINSLDYRTIYTESSPNNTLKSIAEGASIPTTVISLKNNLVKLSKYGRMLVSSYEAIKFQKLDLFTVALKQIGNHIATSQLKQAIDVLSNGDGNSNPAKSINIVKKDNPSESPLTYSNLINLWAEFEEFQMNTLLLSPKTMCHLLNIDEFKNPKINSGFQKTGKLSSPLGAQLFKSSAVPDNIIIALDKNFALEMVCAGDVCVDYDKLIDRQLERATITSLSGFSKICPDAVRIAKLS